MYGIGIGDLGCRNDTWNIEIRIFAWRRTNAHGFISKFYVQGIFIGSGINRYRFYAHFAAGADDPECDLTTISYQYFFEHYFLIEMFVVCGSWFVAGKTTNSKPGTRNVYYAGSTRNSG